MSRRDTELPSLKAAPPLYCAALCRSTIPLTVRVNCTSGFGTGAFTPSMCTAKRREKLNYMHNNPVKRGRVSSPGDWPWSSWRFYFLHDASVLRMDRLE